MSQIESPAPDAPLPDLTARYHSISQEYHGRSPPRTLATGGRSRVKLDQPESEFTHKRPLVLHSRPGSLLCFVSSSTRPESTLAKNRIFGFLILKNQNIPEHSCLITLCNQTIQ